VLLHQVALVAEQNVVPGTSLSSVAAALQKQATRDFGPIWGVQCTVDSFTNLNNVPLGYWPIVVQKDIHQPGAAGVHLDKNGQPYALVQFNSGWSLTASHECLEMLADPFGNRLVAGPSLDPSQGRVEYLVEVCDPSEATAFSYTVNNIVVSDFITPHFYDPVTNPGVRYSFTGAIKEPRQILQGGYISWHDPVSDHWFQQVFFGSQPQIRDLGVLSQRVGSLREWVDAQTRTTHPQLLEAMVLDEARTTAAQEAEERADRASRAKATAWREQMNT
jgi:hypothetical protein